MTEWQGQRAFLDQALVAATGLVSDYYCRNKQDLAIVSKADGSPVTLADQETESLLRGLIAAAYPDDAIYGEEGGMAEGKDGLWIIDPIDGTKSFVCHNPLFGTLLGYRHQGMMVVGGVALPALNEIWTAEIGQDTTCNGAVMRTSGQDNIAEVRLAATSPDYFLPQQYDLFDKLSKQVNFRQFGGDCTLFTALANGGLDMVMEAGLKPHDFLPLVPIVEGAGGVITDWSGAALTFDSKGEVLASASSVLHQWTLDFIANSRA